MVEPVIDLHPSHRSEFNCDPLDGWQVEENDHPIEEVRLTVDPTDNPNIPVLTFRTWLLGVISCMLLAFANAFFGYRTYPLSIGPACAQIITLPIGRFLAKTLPKKDVKVPFTNWSFSLNPGPFSMKEHCLITIFAGAGASFVYSIFVVTIVRVFYHRNIHPMAGFLLAQTSQLVGYGWAGVYRKYLVESPYMWWPENLIQVSLFKALHLKEKRKKGKLTRLQFFILTFVASFAYYIIPGYIFPTISTISVLCLIFKNSITMQQIGSGQHGLGIGSFGLDWSTIAFLGSPLATPATAIFNIIAGFFLGIYMVVPIGYWLNIYNAKHFPLISSKFFDANGKHYNATRIINDKTLTLNVQEEENYSNIYMSTQLASYYGLGLATLTASIMHVALHDGKDIWKQLWKAKENANEKVEDVYTRLTKRNYEPVPQWWFHVLLVLVLGLSIFTCLGFGGQLQLPWWGVLLACAVSLFLTLVVGVIFATTNQGLNVTAEYIIGLILPGKPIANVTFKTYGYVSMAQALRLLSDLNLGHYMKIPPKAMYISQLAGTVISSAINFGTSWFLLSTVRNICDMDKLQPGSPWTCPNDAAFYNVSIMWGLVGPVRMFRKLGLYSSLNYFFVIGFLLPIPFWWLSRAFPKKKWLKHIHIPLLLSGSCGIPPAQTVNYIMWGIVGVFFNYYIYNKYKVWWARHNYVLSTALDAGVAFMSILIFFALQSNNISTGIDWWGGSGYDHCPLASCPTAPGVVTDGCPSIQ